MVRVESVYHHGGYEQDDPDLRPTMGLDQNRCTLDTGKTLRLGTYTVSTRQKTLRTYVVWYDPRQVSMFL